MKFWQLSSKGRIIRAIAALMLCCTLMIGATYAWFSDSASTGINTVTAGNLDVGLAYEYYEFNGDKPVAKWQKDQAIVAQHNLFEYSGLKDDNQKYIWEPGMVVLSDKFAVLNLGSLALKYELSLKVADEKKVDGKSLADVIKVGVLKQAEIDTIHGNELERREGYINAVKAQTQTIVEEVKKNGGFLPISEFSRTGRLTPEDKNYENMAESQLVLVLYWEPNSFEVDNQYNGKGMEITFGLHVNATQTPAEEDSFGPNYDDGILFPSEKAAAVKKKDADMAGKGYLFRSGNDYDEALAGSSYIESKPRNHEPFKVAKRDGTTLYLLSDFNASDYSDIVYGSMQTVPGQDQTIDVDLNGHKMTASSIGNVSSSSGNNGTYILRNGNVELNGQSLAFGLNGMQAISLSDLTINRPNGNVNSDFFKCYSTNIIGAEIKLSNIKVSGGKNQVYVGNNGKIDIGGCTFSNPEGNKSAGQALYISGEYDATTTVKNTTVDGYMELNHTGTTVIEDCTITKDFEMSDGYRDRKKMSLTMKNTTIEGSFKSSTVNSGPVYVTLENVTIKGAGSFIGCSVKIISGTFGFDPGDKVAIGSTTTKNSDGTWTVTKNS